MTPIRRNLIRRVLLGLVVLGTLFLTSCELITGAVGSTDNSLLSLSIKDNNNHSVVLSPGFSHSIKSYTAEVSSDVTSVSVNAIATDGKARVVVLGADANLVEGENTIQVIVTAENGKKASYVVTITKQGVALGTIVVVNQSSVALNELNIVLTSAEDWDPNWLTSPLAPGEEFTLTDVPPGVYDVRALGVGYEWDSFTQGSLGYGNTIEVTDSEILYYYLVDPASLTIENGLGVEISALYIALWDDTDWGNTWLTTPLAAGASITFTGLHEGLYDVKAVDGQGAVVWDTAVNIGQDAVSLASGQALTYTLAP